MEMMCDRIAIIQKGELIEVQRVNDFVTNAELVYEFETGPLGEVTEYLKTEWDATILDTGFTVQIKRGRCSITYERLIESEVNVYSVLNMFQKH